MQVAEHLAQLEDDGVRLADAAAALDAEVLPCRPWTVRDLITHVGGVHRWATSIVRDRLDQDPAPREDDLAVPGPREPVEWFREGHAELLATLRTADPDLQCYTFLPAPSPRAFWARRQAHETAIHRADAETAFGAITPFPASFAVDGIDEMINGFARRRRSFRHVDAARTMAVAPDDAEGWTVTLAPDGVRSTPGVTPAEATVSGSASDLYLWLWNRPAPVVVAGDEDVAAIWRNVRVRWS
jgi:uncharacterized protein (TIGR03083 family)